MFFSDLIFKPSISPSNYANNQSLIVQNIGILTSLIGPYFDIRQKTLLYRATRDFLFSLINKENRPYKSVVKSPGTNAIYDSASYGPTFGGGHDFYIADNSDSNTDSYSNWGNSYSSLYTYYSAQAQSFFAGSKNFQVKEIEVFQI